MGISIWQLGIVLLIVILLFGTKRLRGIGSDLGGAIKSFRTAIKSSDTSNEDNEDNEDNDTSNKDEVEKKLNKKT